MFKVIAIPELIDYLPTFIANKHIEIDEMQLAIDNDDIDKFRFINHKIQGCALCFGFILAHELSYAMSEFYGDKVKMQVYVDIMRHYFSNIEYYSKAA